MKKYSKQREIILESLQNRKDHPTAESLYIDLKRQMPELGIATVYRNLTELCEQGIVKKIKAKVGPDRYDGNVKPHIHFECKKCGEIIDIYLKEEQEHKISNIKKQVSETEEIQCDSSEMYLTGLCQKCKTQVTG